MNYPEIFESKGYIHLPNFLDKENCQQYVNEFQNLIKSGEGKNDPQCPLSLSLGHHPLFDSLLEQLTPNMELATGKKLYPTYAYARWYVPGDELKIHRDRPSCEISATITLGFVGNQWPIYMGYDQNKINCQKIDMQVGDAVVYKGQELYHWREKYKEGQWQVQVFVHYVDQNGVNAEWKYDKREKLAHHTNEEVVSSNLENQYEFHNYYFSIKNAFTKDFCNQLIEKINPSPLIKAGIGDKNEINKEIRDVSKIQLSPNHTIGAALTGMAFNANHSFWKFDCSYSDQTEYLRYDKEGHYVQHVDTFFDYNNQKTMHRKLTTLLFLNDDFEGGKLFLLYKGDKVYPSQNAGDVVIFPSFILHGVEPVTQGIRRSIVTWLVGPNFK